jgi:hypothetical protein
MPTLNVSCKSVTVDLPADMRIFWTLRDRPDRWCCGHRRPGGWHAAIVTEQLRRHAVAGGPATDVPHTIPRPVHRDVLRYRRQGLIPRNCSDFRAAHSHEGMYSMFDASLRAHLAHWPRRFEKYESRIAEMTSTC